MSDNLISITDFKNKKSYKEILANLEFLEKKCAEIKDQYENQSTDVSNIALLIVLNQISKLIQTRSISSIEETKKLLDSLT